MDAFKRDLVSVRGLGKVFRVGNLILRLAAWGLRPRDAALAEALAARALVQQAPCMFRL